MISNEKISGEIRDWKGNKMKFTSEQIEKAAAAIANARIMRRGSPPWKDVLSKLPEKLRVEVMEDAKAALESIVA